MGVPMHEDRILIHLETAPGRYPDTAVAAQALLDWVALVQATLAAIAPEDRVAIEIVGVREGSTRFPQILRWLDDQTGNIRAAWAQYPHLKSIVAGSAHTFYTSAVAAGVSLAMQPSEQVVRLSDEDREILASYTDKAAKSGAVQEASKQFYQTLGRAPEITGIAVDDKWEKGDDLKVIPRSQFPERSGMWELQQEFVSTKRVSRATWDVVLLRAPFTSKPQRWQFSRDGLKFSAKMEDPAFLLAIRERRVPISLQEGVMMRLEIEFKEELDGQVWETIASTRRIIRVLSPAPLADLPSKKP